MFKNRFSQFLISFAILILVTLISQLFSQELGLINIALIHLLPVIYIATRGEIAMTMIISTVSVLHFDLLYVPPIYSFGVHDILYIWSFIIFMAVGYIIAFQARRIRTNEIKEVLLGTLSHDLKTPLSSIHGSISLLLEDTKLTDETRKMLYSDIQDSTIKMDRLITNLLDSARLQDGKHKLRLNWCDFEEIIGVSLDEFGKHKTHPNLTIQIDENIPFFWGDSALLTRLFVNLLDNAFKYARKDGIIKVRIAHKNNTILISFYNQCEPIDEKDLANIFDKFYRLEQNGDIAGSGLGLSICKNITTLHDGKIRAYNKNNGVYFEVELPIKKEPPLLDPKGDDEA